MPVIDCYYIVSAETPQIGVKCHKCGKAKMLSKEDTQSYAAKYPQIEAKLDSAGNVAERISAEQPAHEAGMADQDALRKGEDDRIHSQHTIDAIERVMSLQDAKVHDDWLKEESVMSMALSGINTLKEMDAKIMLRLETIQAKLSTMQTTRQLEGGLYNIPKVPMQLRKTTPISDDVVKRDLDKWRRRADRVRQNVKNLDELEK